jgi:tetratricopeptide (TPR) repeat protein
VSPAEGRLIPLLRQLGSDLLEARAEADEESRLDEVFRTADAIESPQSRFEVLTAFVHELVVNHALKDSLAMRVTAIARVAVRIQRHVDAALAMRLALLLAGKLESLDDEEGAVALLDQEIDSAVGDSGDAIVWRAATAMRLRFLVALKAFDRGNQIVAAYELDERRGADAFELDILVNGAKCAMVVNRQDAAVERALLAIERHQRGDASRRGSAWLDVVVPPTPTARIYLTAGEALRQARRPLEAINAFQQGRRQAVRDSKAHAAAFCLSEVGITWELVGEWARGAAILERAATEAERLGDMKSAARWRKQPVIGDNGAPDLAGVNGLAAVGHALQVGAPTEEHEGIIKALIKQGQADGTQVEPMARNLLAALYERRGDTEFALMAVRAAVDSADRLQAPWLALSLRSNEAKILFKASYWGDAQRLSERVLDDAQRLWDEAGASEVRQIAVAAASSAAEIALLVSCIEGENHKGEPWPIDPHSVRRISDRTRARSFNRWLELVDWSRGVGMPEFENAICSLIGADLAVEWAAQEGQSMNLVLERRDQAARVVAAVVESTGVRLPDAASLVDESEIKLPADAAAIDLSSIESGVVCLFAEQGKSLRVLHIPWERPQRRAWRARWSVAWKAEVQRLGLNRSDLRAPTFPLDEELPVEAGITPTLEALYNELDRDFVRPLVDALGESVERLIASVHAELSFIPLWALTRRRPSLSLSLVPSLRSIGLLASRPLAADGTSIAIGDATGSLAMVERECELLTGFLRLAPTIGALVEAMPSARRVHFAGHGEFDTDNPYLSGLVLKASHQPPQVIATGAFGCGRLTIPGIFERLDARKCELATISACSVGSPRDHAASEFTSVPTALLLAGARNVVAASWHVHDAATTVQMAHFHVELQSAKSIAAALATSRQKLAATTRVEAMRILGREDVLPDGEWPFASPLFTDAMIHFGIG